MLSYSNFQFKNSKEIRYSRMILVSYIDYAHPIIVTVQPQSMSVSIQLLIKLKET